MCTSSHVFGSIHLNFTLLPAKKPGKLGHVTSDFSLDLHDFWIFSSCETWKKIQFNFKVVGCDYCAAAAGAELGCPLDMFIVFHA